MNIRKDDTVVVLTGKDKGKKGKILSVDPKRGMVIVEGISVGKRHTKPRRQDEEGGIIKKETPIYACKVQVVCPKCDKGTRVAHSFVTDKDGNTKKIRVCKHCGAEL